MTALSHSGRSVADVTVEAACNGDLVLDDIRISRETLLKQAENAERSGSLQLGLNLRRAAEMTALSAEDMLAAYEALRPECESVLIARTPCPCAGGVRCHAGTGIRPARWQPSTRPVCDSAP